MNNRSCRGYTLIELMTVLSVTAILSASTVPLGAYWIQRAQLAEGTGELTHSFGKAIAASLRNQTALDSEAAVAAVCISESNQLTVLEAQASTPVSCATNTGNSIWTTSLPERLEVTNSGSDVNCMCFNPNGFLTTENCSGCAVGSTVDLTIGSRSETLNVN